MTTKPAVRYYVNGKRRGDTLNKFGNIAYFNTKGIDGKDRISATELKALLASLGVEDHQAFPWEVTLPNGVVLAAKADDVATATAPKPDRTQARSAAAAAQDGDGTGIAGPVSPVDAATGASASGTAVKAARTKKAAAATKATAKRSKVGGTARAKAVKAANPRKATKAPAKKAGTSSARAKANVTPRPKASQRPTRAN